MYHYFNFIHNCHILVLSAYSICTVYLYIYNYNLQKSNELVNAKIVPMLSYQEWQGSTKYFATCTSTDSPCHSYSHNYFCVPVSLSKTSFASHHHKTTNHQTYNCIINKNLHLYMSRIWHIYNNSALAMHSQIHHTHLEDISCHLEVTINLKSKPRGVI